MKILRIFLVELIKAVRPILGPSGCCIYPLSCTLYAIESLKNKPLHSAFYHISVRVLLCNPFTKKYALKRDKRIF